MCELKSINIKGKPYIEVNERVKFFRSEKAFENWAIETELCSLNEGVCIIKASIRDASGTVKATGYAYEEEGSSFINATSYIENAETSAVGRALGFLGIGIDTSIASAEEVKNAQLNQKGVEKPKQNENSAPSDFSCEDCGKGISEKVYNFSMGKYGKSLCMDCQKKQ